MFYQTYKECILSTSIGGSVLESSPGTRIRFIVVEGHLLPDCARKQREARRAEVVTTVSSETKPITHQRLNTLIIFV
ncbi:hypothetical protein evm_003169 [Chilo suppressalis]|nr:hypothetical protein evm_003169 [Chilo suppressalis]